MKTSIFNRLGRAPGQVSPALGLTGTVLVAASLLLASTSLQAQSTPNGVVVDTLSGGGPAPYYGYVDGNTATEAQFHTPIGLALDTTGTYLFVADRDNNAVRMIDIPFEQAYTFVPNEFTPTNAINNPVGVAVDGDDNLYVLNRGDGSNGSVQAFDYYGDLILTIATGLTNVSGIALDEVANIYVTAGDSVLAVYPGMAPSVVATVTNANAALQGLVVMDDGQLAVCDSGRHGIYTINPATGVISTNTGFNGAGDNFFGANLGITKAHARFNQPYGLAKAGSGFLIVSDYGNNRVKVVSATGTVTNLYGVSSSLWYSPYPGWWDGEVTVPDAVGDVEAREPRGVLLAGDDTVYVTEDYYHLIRMVTGASLPPVPPPPPPPPPVPAPDIGWVEFPPPAPYLSVLRTNQPFVFHNDVVIAIRGTAGAQTHFTYGETGTIIPNPSATVGSTPPDYPGDGSYPAQVPPTLVPPQPDLTIKAIGYAPLRESSYVVSARFQFKTANPLIVGNNAAMFSVTNQTVGAEMWYTLDGSDPVQDSTNSLGPIVSGASLSVDAGSGLTFRIRAFRDSYQPSDIVTTFFSETNFTPNSISFGFASGEASSEFIASPGQTFYAPVTLNPLADTTIYSMQFNLTVTNAGPNPGPAVMPGLYTFQSMLKKPHPDNPDYYITIPPAMFLTSATNAQPGVPPTNQVFQYNDGWFSQLTFSDTNLNLMGVGWLERRGETNLYDTKAQTLITYSMAHDTLFTPALGKVVLGGYAFLVPPTAVAGQTYQINIGRPSATSDGIGTPGSDIYIATPTNGSLTAGAINATKIVTAGQRKYTVGDCAPFRWFNAGDFGNTILDNSDVMQVFQSAIYSLNYPPLGSDFYNSMDSCGGLGVLNPNGYFLPGATVTDPNTLNLLFDGNDLTINSMPFGDGFLDVCDVYVTFRRSLDPSLAWFQRFWTNGVLASEQIAQPSYFYQPPAQAPSGTTELKGSSLTSTNPGSVNFAAGDALATAGQVLYIPITAKIFGDYPLRVLMLNLSVEPLDGSPALTSPVQFTPNVALGTPTMSASTGNGNYSGAWLNSSIAGLTGSATLGTLRVVIPAAAPSSAAYAIHFDHASASPNGIGSFPAQTLTGLILLSDRSASSFNDGIPDSWRLRYFGTVNNYLSQAAADAEGDGGDNWQEYIAGTDPTDAKSLLSAATLRDSAQQPQDCVIRWPSVSGKQYVIERAASLFGAGWTPVCTNTGTGGNMEFHDLTGGNLRFYRVRVTP